EFEPRFPLQTLACRIPVIRQVSEKGLRPLFSFSAPEPSGETFLHLPLSIIGPPHVIFPVVLILLDAPVER
ncbi:hypothetical protein, partial [Serratia montpellierensis]|uniref:hypothetical protein n=1 Tax=Serratia montpellierensis TaxID=2598730 RepID=UPI001E60FD4A